MLFNNRRFFVKSRLMKTDSIRFRFTLIVLVCLAGLCLLIYSQLYYTNKLISLNQQNALLLKVERDLLHLRRFEKDFLLRKDAFLSLQFNQHANEFQNELRQLIDVIQEHDLDSSLGSNMQIAFDEFRVSFSNVYDTQVQMGLNENTGEHGRFRTRIHALEEQLNALGNPNLQVMLLQLRRHEKDFMQRKKMQYVELEKSQYLELKQRLLTDQQLNSNRLLNLLDDYHKGFLTLVGLYQQIGLNQHTGLLGMLTEQSEALEDHLSLIDSVLSPAIEAQETTVRKHGIVIVGMTALALLALLVRSFMTFQKAFTDFVLFFYRCKRIKQPLDERKMNFIEFKSLAAAANEMIESQRQTEIQLKSTKEQLDKLRDQHTTT